MWAKTLFSSLNVKGFFLFCFFVFAMSYIAIQKENKIIFKNRKKLAKKKLISFDSLAPHLENCPKEKAKM